MPQYGRLAVAAVIVTYVVIFSCTLLFGWMPTWSTVGVRPMSQPFGDLRAITGATLTIDRGLDPLKDNVGDPWHRPANYPRVWMATAHALRLTPRTTVPYALVLFLFFIGSLAVMARLVAKGSDAVVFYLFAVTPAALLCVERGKIEFVVLTLVCGVTAVRQPTARVGLLTGATLLKLFPVFGLAAFTVVSRRARWIGLCAFGLIGVWAYYARADLRLIQSSVPVDSQGAYGLSSLAIGLWHITGGDRRVSWALAIVISVSAASLGWWLARAGSPIDPATTEQLSGARTVGLLMAASIYIGTFGVASNYDYRLVFLLPALPFLNALRHAGIAKISWMATFGIATMLVAMSETPLTVAFGHAGAGINDIAKIATIGTLTWALTLRPTSDRGSTHFALSVD